ncbi:MAG: radical SAM protein [Nitrosopumilaceae archaeon]|nr:radical SAM protein [Nitrosopumilaceae archaeon]
MALIQIANQSIKKTGKKSAIRFTQSICPECNMILDAEIFERKGQVYMTKTCPSHGECEELYFGSYALYQKFSTYWMDGKGTHAPNVMIDKCSCPNNCGLCSNHLSHSGLANMIVTNRCDLTCWYCFFYVKKGLEGAYMYEPSHDQVRSMMKTLRAERPIPGNSIQITGGEPMLREDITDIIKIMKEEGVDHIQMNTNGIRHAMDPEAAREVRLAGCNNLYLSFDGVTPRTNPKNHWEIPHTLDSCRKTGTTVVFVPTVIKSINDHELGGIIRYAQKNMDVVHAVNFQPVSLTGRMGKTEREKYRITIPDCIQRIEEQTNGEVTIDDWFPVPSCMPLTNVIEAFSSKPKYELSIHFACGAGTYIFEDEDTKKFVPLTKFCDIQGMLELFEDKSEEMRSGKNKYFTMLEVVRKLSSFIDKKKQPTGLDLAKMFGKILMKRTFDSVGSWHVKGLFLGMMHFQDKYNEDLERLQRCDIHYLTPDLRIIPFCAFNVIPEWYRDRIQKKYSITVEEWEKREGVKLEDGLYRGLMRRGAGDELAAGCAKSQMFHNAQQALNI